MVDIGKESEVFPETGLPFPIVKRPVLDWFHRQFEESALRWREMSVEEEDREKEEGVWRAMMLWVALVGVG